MEFCLAMLLFSALGEMLEELFNYRCEWLSVRKMCPRSKTFNETGECGDCETPFAKFPTGLNYKVNTKKNSLPFLLFLFT